MHVPLGKQKTHRAAHLVPWRMSDSGKGQRVASCYHQEQAGASTWTHRHSDTDSPRPDRKTHYTWTNVCTTSQSYRASPAIWDHTVIPVTRHRWMCPALTQANTQFTYLHPRRDGSVLQDWVDLGVGYIPRYGLPARRHSPTKWVRSRATSFIKINMLTTTQSHHRTEALVHIFLTGCPLVPSQFLSSLCFLSRWARIFYCPSYNPTDSSSNTASVFAWSSISLTNVALFRFYCNNSSKLFFSNSNSHFINL